MNGIKALKILEKSIRDGVWEEPEKDLRVSKKFFWACHKCFELMGKDCIGRAAIITVKGKKYIKCFICNEEEEL